MSPTAVEILATVLFALAVLHTFLVKRFAHWAHKYPEGSIPENLLHFMAETEVVFGVWAAALFGGIIFLNLHPGSLSEILGSVGHAVEAGVKYIEEQNYTEPKFVLVIMVVAATRPVVALAEWFIEGVARALPLPPATAFYAAALAVGPLLGSFITEPAAMTLLAVVLKRRYFNAGISKKLAYATLGLLFVNVSIGGVLTHFAAPPVLMVASKWKWSVGYMFQHFGWRAVLSCLVSTAAVVFVFRKELKTITVEKAQGGAIPVWLTALHLMSMAAVVLFAHHPDVFFGIFMMFLGLVTVTREYQDPLKLKEGLLVGFFLSGLVTLGSLQEYWLKPLIQALGGDALFFGTIGLTAITDNAALTYLGSLVDGLSDPLKYALVAGAVTGGGLTVIANAPNPAGAGILQDSKVFDGEGISPLNLLLGALWPTAAAIVAFWFLPGPR
jgi:Putative Na+/H+ antiporter